MKILNKLFVILVIGSGGILFSCSSDFLEENPTNFVAPETFFNNLQDAEIAVAGAYNALQNDWTFDMVGQPVHWGNKGVDELNTPGWAGGGRRELHLYQITPSMAAIENLWAGHYRGINTANGVIDRVGAMSDDLIDVEDRDRIVAEAKFVRAILYFSAVKIWENIPLITEEVTNLNDLEVPQAKPDAVYAQIIEDLQAGKEFLPAGQGAGRATQGAATALLGKVYLQMTGFPLNQRDKASLAAAEFAEVIESGVYNLLPEYGEVFQYTNDNNNEIVYAVSFEGPSLEEGSAVGSYMGPNGSQQNGGGWGTEYINQDLVSSYEEQDVRLEWNVSKINVNNDATVGQAAWRPWKWHKPKPNNFLYDSPFDFQYLRYADVLLSRAEALSIENGGPTDEAIDLVNQIRARANATLWESSAITQDSFVVALLDERRRELCFEGHRHDDLIRLGKFKDVIMSIDQSAFWSSAGNPGDNYDDHEIRWPIPQREMDLNPGLTQNPGYQ
ncbi:MAG: RagB/SusD family nutrient uptake outer membrane protein [Bacteroidota bacterium]